MTAMAEIICICGGIGSGKSVVSRICRLNGFTVYDCDAEAKRLMQESPELREGIIQLLGEEAYLSDGGLDRRFVADRIFSDKEMLARMNSLVHGAVRRDVQSRLATVTGISFVESAIPATSGLLDICDGVWLVTADEKVRVRRAVERQLGAGSVGGHVPERGEVEKEIWRRVESQREEERRVRSCGLPLHEIENGEDSLLRQVGALLDRTADGRER